MRRTTCGWAIPESRTNGSGDMEKGEIEVHYSVVCGIITEMKRCKGKYTE